MTALAAERLRKAREGVTFNGPVKAVTQTYQGGLIMLLAGVLVPARAAATRAELSTIRVIGLAKDSILGGAADGDQRLDVERGIFLFLNSAAGEALTEADVGNMCFVADDQTVAKTIGGGMRPIAGRVEDVDADGVWVDTRVAAGPRRIYLPFAINETDTLAPTSQELVSPRAGAITYLSTTVQKAITTGGDMTVNVAGVAVAGLDCVIPNAAAKGSIVNDTPTAGDATTIVAEGSRIEVVPSAPFATAGAVSGYLEITY